MFKIDNNNLSALNKWKSKHVSTFLHQNIHDTPYLKKKFIKNTYI